MEFSKLSSVYFVLSFLGVASYWVGNVTLSIILRTLGLFVLLYEYWNHVKEENHLLFYLSILVVSVAEAFIIYGYEHHSIQIPTISLIIVYYWLNFFLLRKTTRENSIKYHRINWTILVLVLLLLAYLIFNFVGMMSEELVNTKPFVYASIFSFVLLCVHCIVIYFNKRSFRNFWLLLLATTIILAQSTLPLEALYFRSVYLKTIGFIAEILGHFFVLQYLITPEKEIVLQEGTEYL